MAKLAAHIKEARKHGTEAGFNFWWDYISQQTDHGSKGLPQVQDLYNEVKRIGKLRTRGSNAGTFKNPEAALEFYCNKYAKDLGNTPRVKGAKRNTRAASTTAPENNTGGITLTDEQIEALAALGISVAGMDTDDEDEDDVEPEAEASPASTRRVSRPKAQADEPQAYPEPRDRDADATQGKLWKLNSQGPENGIFLCVIDSEGEILAGGDAPITAGEAYDLIGEFIAA